MVVVDTVCVVVVVAYTPWSPRLPSDLEDSESLETGKAREELRSSPYAGGALTPLCLSDSSNVMRDSLALGLADVGPLALCAEVGVLADKDCLLGCEVRALIVSGALARRGRVKLVFFLLTPSKLSVGAVVIIDGARVVHIRIFNAMDRPGLPCIPAGKGGRLVSACSRAVLDICGSLACRNLSILKR